jgi:TolB protein
VERLDETDALFTGADRGGGVVGLCGGAVALLEKAEATFPGKNGKISYVFYGGGGGIYTTNPGGGGNTKVANGGEGPAYSPNGKRIAYSCSDGHDQEIYTINVGGGGKFKVTNNTKDDEEPSYSPDGKKIAYTSYKVLGSSDDEDFDSEIYMINIGRGGKSQVTNTKYPSSEPSWGSRP